MVESLTAMNSEIRGLAEVGRMQTENREKVVIKRRLSKRESAGMREHMANLGLRQSTQAL